MSTDALIFLFVVGLRFGVPLLIPRFPLPAVLAALVIDAADQTIFQQYTDLDLDGYQGYDKALDVYYLAIAYLSTIRNWTDPFAAGVARFLWYYRLVGVMLFELIEVRALLIIFANTFEYFFIAYELIRCWSDPRRLGRRFVLIMAAVIWIFVKLPQEYWIHIAQLDFTNVMKNDVLGVDVDASWGTALGQNLWFVALLIVVAALVTFGIKRLRERLPDPDWAFTVSVDRHLERPQYAVRTRVADFTVPLVAEKVVLTSLITIIFSQIIPDYDASPLPTTFAIGIIVVASAAVSQWLSGRGVSWTSTGREFGAMVLINVGIVIGYIILLRRSDTPINEAATVFFVLLLTLIITLFDRFHAGRGRSAEPVPELASNRV